MATAFPPKAITTVPLPRDTNKSLNHEAVVDNEAEEVDPQIHVGLMVKSRWKLIRQLTQGGFGQIFLGHDVKTQEMVAVKTESVKCDMPLLKMEVRVLRKLQGKDHVVKFLACGRHVHFNYLVMSLVGHNLMQLKKSTPFDRFSVQTSVRVAIQMVRGLQHVHEVGYLHRDIKPSNYAVGRSETPNARTVFIIDFGLCRQFRSEEGSMRLPRYKCGFRGTVRYASVNIHKNKEMGRHDDLWSLFYMVVEMMNGQLPWRRLLDKSKVMKLKETITPDQLLIGLPTEMHLFLDELKPLGYFDVPLYDKMVHCFQEILRRNHVTESTPYDWEIPSETAYTVPSIGTVTNLAAEAFNTPNNAAVEESQFTERNGSDKTVRGTENSTLGAASVAPELNYRLKAGHDLFRTIMLRKARAYVPWPGFLELREQTSSEKQQRALREHYSSNKVEQL